MSVRFRFCYNCMRILCVPILFLIGFITPVLSWNNLPSGYTELEYIESTGAQWINTGLTANSEEVTINLIMANPSGVSDKSLGWVLDGRQSSSPYPGFMIARIDNGNTSVWTGSGWLKGNISTDFTNIDFTRDSSTYTANINGTASSGSVTGTAISNVTVKLLSGSGYRKLKKAYIKVGSEERNFIPAKRNSDSTIGMYDTVNNTFYTNSGTGTFTAGPEVEKPEIKIATTSYVESAFADSVDELNETIGTIKTVVDNTIIQADRIGKLYTGKQNRPDDSSDSEKCPAGRECLLITEPDGTLHWYPICDENGSVEPLFDVSAFLSQLTSDGDNRYYHGNTTTYNALGITGSAYTRQPSSDSIVRQLNETEWAVLWNNIGVVYGTSVCNSNSGTFAVASSDEQTETKGQNCWCKMTSVGDRDKVEHSVSGSAWVVNITASSAADCAYYCASNCASNVRYFATFRSALVGVGN